MGIFEQYILVSPIFPSGITIPLNVLLELNIRIYRDDKNTFWLKQEDMDGTESWKMIPTEFATLQQWLPVLKDHQNFRFPEDASVCWKHNWPAGLTCLEGKYALLVRDGRDAVFSHFKRTNSKLDFPMYLRKPFIDESSSGFVSRLRLPPAEIWALFCLLWKDLIGDDECIFRFEEFKQAGISEMQRLLSFLDVTRSRSEISDALECSSFERAHNAEISCRRSNAISNKQVVNRRGKVGEWRESYKGIDKMAFDGLPSYALGVLGYELSSENNPSPIDYCPPIEHSSGHWIALAMNALHDNNYALAVQSLQNAVMLLVEDDEETFRVGRAILAYFCVNDLIGKTAITSGLQEKWLLSLLASFSYMVPKPLNLAAVAQALAWAGNPSAASGLLKRAELEYDTCFYEIAEISKVSLELSCDVTALDLCRRAMRIAPSDEDIYEFMSDICILTSPALVKALILEISQKMWAGYTEWRSLRFGVSPWKVKLGAQIPHGIRCIVKY